MVLKSSEYLNRELSWLEFNQRVLDEARDESLPVLERLKFIAITASNLDEFFMVRVGGLKMMIEEGINKADPSGASPTEQLAAINSRCQELVKTLYDTLLNQIEPLMQEAGIFRQHQEELTEKQHRIVGKYIEEEILSILTPMVVDPDEAFPSLINQSLNVCIQVENEESERRFVIIPFGHNMQRFITLPSESGYQYILLEQALSIFMGSLFPGEKVIETVPFRITRNADFQLREDLASDLMEGMKEVLDSRKEGNCVRLEISENVTSKMFKFLCKGLQVEPELVYAVPGPIGLSAFMQLAFIGGFDELRNESWPSLPTAEIDPRESMFEAIARKDLVLSHPYESYDPVVRLLEEAAEDPDVLAIKQTLYRTSSDSAIVAALIKAADKGKHVTALVELKARFDEARNIEWASKLEQAGIQVIYGVKGLKTHAKICVIVRREPSGIRKYIHFGTGNYNESTAKLYSDISLMTCNEDYGTDATNFFNAVTGYSQPHQFRKLEMAPIGLRDKILEMIEVETARKKQGEKARITAKFNSLVDPEIIEAFYKASQAGVKIYLNIRGICCLKPGVEGLSENIMVISVIDRFLEHSRIFHFLHGGDNRVYISSADMMTRNLDRRVELLVPVEDQKGKEKLIDILGTYFKDNCKSHVLNSDGSYTALKNSKNSQSYQAQAALYQMAQKNLEETERSQQLMFEPHRAANK